MTMEIMFAAAMAILGAMVLIALAGMMALIALARTLGSIESAMDCIWIQLSELNEQPEPAREKPPDRIKPQVIADEESKAPMVRRAVARLKKRRDEARYESV